MSEDIQNRPDRLAYLGALAGGLAHEIRNPLSTINLNLDLLREEYQPADSEKARRILRKIDVIQKEAKRLESMLNSFLSLARGNELNLSEHDINEFLDDLLSFLAPKAAAANIQIRRGLSPGIPHVSFDEALLRQAVLNLLKNGMEAMPNGGDLIARTSLAGDAVQIDLADTGTGIPPDKAAKVFRPYFTTKKAGTGLGLATVKRIVDDHGGQIHFTSEPGKGTNFTIRLPVRPAASGRQAARSDTR